MADTSIAGGWQPGGGPSDRRDSRFGGLTDVRDEEPSYLDNADEDGSRQGSKSRVHFDDDDYEHEDDEDSHHSSKESKDADEDVEPLDPCQQEWEENLSEWARLDQVLKEIHPKLKDTRTMIVDKEMTDMVKARKNPTLRFTGKLMCGMQPYMHTEPVERGSWQIPRLIIVTGHKGAHGNIGMNGIYERCPDDHHTRPVYCKTLTKRTNQQDPFLSTTKWRPGGKSCAHIPAQAHYDGPTTMGPTPPGGMPYFLYFDNTQGCWCIGPKVGERKRICARCPGCADPVPVNLLSWECWDVGQREWYWHRGLQAIKGGR